MIEELALELIRRDGGTQPRAFINAATVEEYAEVLTDGGMLPPAVVFYDGETYWLADGYHRFKAAAQVGFKTYPCEVRQGTLQDAQWFSFGANKTHGLRRTNQDKQRAVEAALKHPLALTMSTNALAEHLGVSAMTISRYKEPISNNVKDTGVRTVTRKGKTYTQKTANIGRRNPAEPQKPVAQPTTPTVVDPEPEPEPEPVIETTVAPTTISFIDQAIELLLQSPPDVSGALRILEPYKSQELTSNKKLSVTTNH